MSKLLAYLNHRVTTLDLELKKVGSNSKKAHAIYIELEDAQEALKEAEVLKDKGNKLTSYLTGGLYNYIDTLSAEELIMKHRYLLSKEQEVDLEIVCTIEKGKVVDMKKCEKGEIVK